MRKSMIGSFTALVAALALTASAAPASAAVIGKAWTGAKYSGLPVDLEAVNTCTVIYTGGLLTADSAINFEGSGVDIQFFDDDDCGADDLIDTLVESFVHDAGVGNFEVNVVAYKTV